MDTIGSRLKFLREARGWTQAQLASAAGLSQSTIGNIESGARQAKASLVDVAEALRANYKWLLHGEGERYAPLVLPAPSKGAAALEVREPSGYLGKAEVAESIKLLEALPNAALREALVWLRGFAAGQKR